MVDVCGRARAASYSFCTALAFVMVRDREGKWLSGRVLARTTWSVVGLKDVEVSDLVVDVPHLETAVYGILEAGKTIASNNKEEHAHVSIHHTNVYRHSL